MIMLAAAASVDQVAVSAALRRLKSGKNDNIFSMGPSKKNSKNSKKNPPPLTPEEEADPDPAVTNVGGYPYVELKNTTPYPVDPLYYWEGEALSDAKVWYAPFLGLCSDDQIEEGIAPGGTWSATSRGGCLVKQIDAKLTLFDGRKLKCASYLSFIPDYLQFSILYIDGVCCVRSSQQTQECPPGKKGESCASPWWDACEDGLSCYDSGSNGRYCVPNGQENACCGGSGDDEAWDIDCDKGLSCDNRSQKEASGIDSGTVPTCHPNTLPLRYSASFAKKGSCNVNTGEPANTLIELKCYKYICGPRP